VVVDPRAARCGLPTIPCGRSARQCGRMSIAIWIVCGALVGLLAARLRPGRFPGGTLGATVTGVVGGFVGGGLFAALDDRNVNGFDVTTTVSAIVGAALMLAAMKTADHAEPRPY
jgi:uncharacterized membrane protein YeaQ/YmgE (transglycosylase-associated protein family)